MHAAPSSSPSIESQAGRGFVSSVAGRLRGAGRLRRVARGGIAGVPAPAQVGATGSLDRLPQLARVSYPGCGLLELALRLSPRKVGLRHAPTRRFDTRLVGPPPGCRPEEARHRRVDPMSQPPQHDAAAGGRQHVTQIGGLSEYRAQNADRELRGVGEHARAPGWQRLRGRCNDDADLGGAGRDDGLRRRAIGRRDDQGGQGRLAHQRFDRGDERRIGRRIRLDELEQRLGANAGGRERGAGSPVTRERRRLLAPSFQLGQEHAGRAPDTFCLGRGDRRFDSGAVAAVEQRGHLGRGRLRRRQRRHGLARWRRAVDEVPRPAGRLRVARPGSAATAAADPRSRSAALLAAAATKTRVVDARSRARRASR